MNKFIKELFVVILFLFFFFGGMCLIVRSVALENADFLIGTPLVGVGLILIRILPEEL